MGTLGEWWCFRTEDPDPHHVIPNLVYGWSSEDDLHFPTHGSTLQIAAGTDYSALQFRKTWPMLGGWGTVIFGGEPNPEYQIALSESQLLAFAFARPIAPGNIIQRGRWYIEPGSGGVGYNSDGVFGSEHGIKAGVRADTRVRPRRTVRARQLDTSSEARHHPAAPAREQQRVRGRSVHHCDEGKLGAGVNAIRIRQRCPRN